MKVQNLKFAKDVGISRNPNLLYFMLHCLLFWTWIGQFKR